MWIPNGQDVSLQSQRIVKGAQLRASRWRSLRPVGRCTRRPAAYAAAVRHPDEGRFLTIPQVAEELATSEAQISALVKRGDLPAFQVQRAAVSGASNGPSLRSVHPAPRRSLSGSCRGRRNDVSADEHYGQEEGGKG